MLNKKGDISSIIIMIVVLLALGLGAIIFSYTFKEVTNELKEMPQFSNDTVENIEEVQGKTIPLLDYFIFFTFIALLIGLIISSIYIDTHPALAIIFIIVLVVAIVLAGIFANVYMTVGENSVIASTYSDFRMTTFLMENFPLFILITGAIILIVLYGKSKGGAVAV